MVDGRACLKATVFEEKDMCTCSCTCTFRLVHVSVSLSVHMGNLWTRNRRTWSVTVDWDTMKQLLSTPGPSHVVVDRPECFAIQCGDQVNFSHGDWGVAWIIRGGTDLEGHANKSILYLS